MPEEVDLDAEALELFATRTDPRSRARIVAIYDVLAQRLAARFRGRGVAPDDLLQVARFGLLNAIDRFDPERGVKFTTFAGRTIVGELKHHFRDHSWSMRVPRSLQNLWLETSKTVDQLTQRLGRNPTIAEIANDIGVTEEEVLEALDAGGAFNPASLDQPVGESASTSLGDLLGTVDASLDVAAERTAVAEHLAALPDRERIIIYLRFFEGRSQSEIAAEVGISQVHVSRLLAKTIGDLRRALGETEPAEEHV